jgi:hypothetical protein
MALTIQYEGPEIERGRMNADELGPAILGLSQMIGRTSRVLYGDETRVRLEVQADFRRGSFGVEFFAVASVSDLVPALDWEQLAKIAGVLFGGGGVLGGGVLGLMKLLKGRKPRETHQEGDNVTITNERGDIQVFNLTVYNTYTDSDVRQGFKALARPLDHEGIDAVEILPGSGEPQRIEREDRDAVINAPPPGDTVSLTRFITVLEIVSPVFREGNKWRFRQGESYFYAAIQDEVFLALVERREIAFGRGDALRVELEIEVTESESAFGYDRRITRVLDHLIGGRGDQLRLPGAE